MAHDPVHDEDVAEVSRLTAEAASALIRGDVRTYLTFFRHADDYTLLQPFGGEPRRGFDSSDEALEATARFFHGGDATSRSSSPTRPAISSSLWLSNGSTVKSATSRTRTGLCE
jgi:hypothetical protein